MKTVNIYGEVIEGEIVAEETNVVIVEDTKGGRHVVHKETIDPKTRRKTFDENKNLGRFDLLKCQTIGRKSTEARKARRIS